MIAAAALLLHVTRGQSLYADEWYFFMYRSYGSAETLLAPHDGNFCLVTLLLYRLVFHLFGPDVTILRLILIALELFCAGLFFDLARRRVGEWIALGGATLLLFLGAGWLLVTTVGITLYLAVALGLAALIAIERETRRGDLVACMTLTLAVASYSAALPFAGGAVIAIALRPARLRWSRAWVVAVPLVLYGIWRVWAAYYTQHPKVFGVTETVIAPGALTKAPSFIGKTFAAGLASATGLFKLGGEQQFAVDPSWAVPLVVIFVAATLARFLWPGRPPRERRVWVFLAMPVAYWTALCFVAQRVPGTEIVGPKLPTSAGYQYTSVVLLLLAAAALACGVRIPRLARLALAAVLLASLVPNLLTLRQAARAYRLQGAIDRAELAAAELVGNRAARVSLEDPNAPRATFPDLVFFPPQKYLAAARRFGSAALPASSLVDASPEARRAADLTLIRLYALAPRPSGPAPPSPKANAPSLENRGTAPARAHGRCLNVPVPPTGTLLSFVLPRGGFSLRAGGGPPVGINVRRFTDPPGIPTRGSVAGGRTVTLSIPADASAQPWRLLIAPTQPVRVCALDTARPQPRQART